MTKPITYHNLERILHDHIDNEHTIYHNNAGILGRTIGEHYLLGNEDQTKNSLKPNPSLRFGASDTAKKQYLENDVDTARVIVRAAGLENKIHVNKDNAPIIIKAAYKTATKGGWKGPLMAALGIGASIGFGAGAIDSVQSGQLALGILAAIGSIATIGFTIGGISELEKERKKKVTQALKGGILKDRILEKVAAVYAYQKENKYKLTPAVQRNKEYKENLETGMFVGGLAAVPLQTLANKTIIKELDKTTGYGTMSMEEFMARARNARPHLSDIEFRPGSVMESEGPHYMPKVFNNDHYVSMAGSKNLGILAHEVGHADDLAKHVNVTRGRMLLSLLGRSPIGKSLIPALMVNNDKTRDYAIPAYLASYAPTLFDEARANYKGNKLLKEIVGKPEARNFLKTVVPANTASYWAVPAAMGATLYGFKRHLDKKYDRRKKKRDE